MTEVVENFVNILNQFFFYANCRYLPSSSVGAISEEVDTSSRKLITQGNIRQRASKSHGEAIVKVTNGAALGLPKLT